MTNEVRTLSNKIKNLASWLNRKEEYLIESIKYDLSNELDFLKERILSREVLLEWYKYVWMTSETERLREANLTKADRDYYITSRGEVEERFGDLGFPPIEKEEILDFSEAVDRLDKAVINIKETKNRIEGLTEKDLDIHFVHTVIKELDFLISEIKDFNIRNRIGLPVPNQY
jgi:hypothetical protein